MKIKTVLILLLCNLASVCMAQPFCDVRTFNIRDGLAANTISEMNQNNDDMMWFATWNGICCFDGYRFMTFRDTPGENEVLSTNRIRMVKPNTNGDIWCISYDFKLYLFSTKECRFINVSKIIKDKYNQDIQFRNIYTLSNGYTWAICSDRVANFRICDKSYDKTDGITRVSMADHNICDNYIRKITMDINGNEWLIGNHTTMIYGKNIRFNKQYEYIVHVGSKTFLCTKEGELVEFRNGQRQVKRITLPKGVDKINKVASLDSHTMILATNMGIVLYDTNTAQTRIISIQSPNQPSPDVDKFFVDSKKRIWAFGEGEGVTMIDIRKKETRWMMTKPMNDLEKTTSQEPLFIEDINKHIWLIPVKGSFCYYDEATKGLTTYRLLSSRTNECLPSVIKYYIDKQNNLWFTGIHDLTFVKFGYRHFHKTDVMSNQEVRALLFDHTGKVWAGTHDGQLAVFSHDLKRIGFMNRNGNIQSTPVNFASMGVYAIFEDSKHRLWIGTKGDGIYIIETNRGVRHFKNDAKDQYSLNHNEIYCFDEDKSGRIWIGTYNKGLDIAEYLPDGRIKFYNPNNLLKNYPSANNKIRRITHTKDGIMLLSTNKGLITCRSDISQIGHITFYVNKHVMNDTTSLSSPDVMQTLVMRNGHIYTTTQGGGVQEIQSGNLLQNKILFRTLKQFNNDEGIVLSLSEDRKGNLWVIREGSINKYDPKNGHTEPFEPNDLGKNIEFSEAEPCYNIQKDVILTGTMGGFISFIPSHLKKSQYTPRIVFTSVQYQGDAVARPILNSNELTIPSDRRNITISFAALDYSDNYLIRYAYKIEGVDKEWNYVGGAHSASFNRLPPGHLRLVVKSTNSDGVWVDNQRVLNIYAQPTFWETVWAKILYVLIIVGIVYVSAYIYRLRNKAQMEQEMSDMKTRFFTEIGHKLRTPLTLIGGPVTEVLNTSRLEEKARHHLEMVQRNSQWMLDLVNKMLDYSKTHNLYISDENAKVFANDEESINELNDERSEENDKRIRLLIVEDNDDLRYFLTSILDNEYTIIQAEDGQKGLEMAEREMPDFIISDVMMPVMDGLTMVHQIKQNKDICHIPIIILSAKASLDDRLQGLKEGIDDYITKPFSATYLKQRVRNIIDQRRMLQQTYIEQIVPEDSSTFKLEAPQIVDADKEMMKKLLDYMNENISNANIRIEDLADAVNLGRTVFYGKIKSITGMTPIDFVHHIRIERAEELIANSNYQISQISYLTGFSDPKYFSHSFKKDTGMTPSEYRDKAK